MKMKNFDGIKKLKNPQIPAGSRITARKLVKVDAVFKGRLKPTGKKKANFQALSYNVPFWPAKNELSFWPAFAAQIAGQRVALLAAVMALFLAFGAGMWFVLDSGSSRADAGQPQVLGEAADAVVLPLPLSLAQSRQINNQALFNTPIQLLKNYLDDVSRPDIIARRAELIKQYLIQKHSPLAEAAQTIAEQEHWEYILPIAFAESTLGKNCSDNNCSNIGVKPGVSSWRHYASYDAWVVDFNRLLDKRYKDWTLQQMCGVYVKPCNPNWLLATQQVLDELQQIKVE
jgi:hypothetical protein